MKTTKKVWKQETGGKLPEYDDFEPRSEAEAKAELEEKQANCPYCHEPFLDFSGKASYEVDYDDLAYCGTDDYGNLEYGASFDSGCVNKNEYVKIKYCPMCGRKLGDEE